MELERMSSGGKEKQKKASAFYQTSKIAGKTTIFRNTLEAMKTHRKVERRARDQYNIEKNGEKRKQKDAQEALGQLITTINTIRRLFADLLLIDSEILKIQEKGETSTEALIASAAGVANAINTGAKFSQMLTTQNYYHATTGGTYFVQGIFKDREAAEASRL